MIKQSSWLLILLILVTDVTATPQEDAQAFVDQLSSTHALPDNEQNLNDKVKQISRIVPQDEKDRSSLQDIQNMYTNNMNYELKTSDPLQQNLNMKRLDLPKDSNINDTEALMRQKNHWYINENDSIFSNKTLQPEDNKIITCREGAKGETKSCIKNRIIKIISGNATEKTIKISVTGSLAQGALLGIDLKNGKVFALNAQDLANINYNRSNEIYAVLNLLFIYHPALIVPKNLSINANEILESEGNTRDLTIHNLGFVKHANSKIYIKQIIFEEPSAMNEYIAKIGLVHWNYIDYQNPSYPFGFDITWKVTIPPCQMVIDHWEGCELLENNLSCKEKKSKYLERNETRMITGYLEPITRSHWAEEKEYHCEMGTSANECEKINKAECEQIASRCVIEKNGYCIEFEQSFQCGKHESHRNEDFDIENSIDEILSEKSQTQILENYDPNEFGNALTQFSAVKAMTSPMLDDLGGISGDPNNPSVFSGLCRRCTVTLGSSFKDCCDLKGIAQGLLGGCKTEEKQLAVAEVKDKRCHKIAKKYCTHKVLGKCVEKKEAYCCYGSQLAKIVQEIAHEQLDISWGDGENPNCVSLTAEQLSRLNFDTVFAKAKLNELFAEYQATAQDKTKQVKANTSIDVNAKIESLQKDLTRRFNTQRSS